MLNEPKTAGLIESESFNDGFGSTDSPPPRFDDVENMNQDELTEEIKQFERYLYGCAPIRDLVSTSTNIPLGFNQNGSKPDSKDIGSLITTALSSNLYHNGLAAIDYMRIKEKLSPYISSEG
jgi:hypothetical protein